MSKIETIVCWTCIVIMLVTAAVFASLDVRKPSYRVPVSTATGVQP